MSTTLIRPGVNVTLRSNPSALGGPTNTGVWFVVGLTDAGPTKPTLIRNMNDYLALFGQRVAYSVLYDALDMFFREGGGSAYIARVVGPAAVTASHNLLDASAGIALVASALGPGASGNAVSVGVRAGQGAGNFVVFVVVGGVEVETSPDLADNPTAVLWAQNSQNIRLALGASANDPAVAAAAALAGGNDDRSNIVDAQWQAALDAITTDFGPGQVSAPGRTTDPGHQQLVTHAGAHRRVAILDAPDTATLATLQASALGARVGTSSKFGSMYWPWQIIPGVVSGSTRSVPPSALIAGLLARNDNAGLGPDQAAAGDQGVSLATIALSQPAMSDTNRQTANQSGVNVVRSMYGTFRNYGWRSLVDPVAEQDWVNFGCGRLYMAIAADAQALAEGFMFDKIDGRGSTISKFNGVLSAMLQGYYNSGDLYGASASDAYFVDTGSSVNTPTTIANHELHAVLNVRMSEFAEMVQIEVYKIPINA
jgi:phage tail sheath protein FI